MIRDQFQVTADAFGNLRVAAGWVLQPRHDVAIRVASFEDSGLPNAQPLADGSRWPAHGPQNTTFVGGSGRNVIVTGLGASTLVPVGFYLPGQAGKYGCVNGPFTIQPGAGTFDISDGTDVLASAAITLVPYGDYVATAYGETNYGGSATFTLTVADEDGSGGIPGMNVAVSAGTATSGVYNPISTTIWESDGASDWTLEIAADGTAEINYIGDTMATRQAGPLDDPSGVYEATENGKTDHNGGAPWSAFVTAIRIAPRAGWVYLQITESSGVLNSVAGPFFTTSLPTHSGSIYYYPIARCDGYNAPEQIHLGPVQWA